MKALSVRQPWAWLIVNGHKDIENRDWATKRRGRIWIHAGMHRVTKAEYEEFVADCEACRICKYPKIEGFKTGGIVGSVEIVDCVTKSNSYWFSGKYGFVLKNARTTRFRRMHGKLNFFEVIPER
jgi:hypothetical protein